MDRFIASSVMDVAQNRFNLKSNMDRFIDLNLSQAQRELIYLKSNMDRFIARLFATLLCHKAVFKIQYG